METGFYRSTPASPLDNSALIADITRLKSQLKEACLAWRDFHHGSPKMSAANKAKMDRLAEKVLEGK
jgi:hypothetical protein